MIAPCFIRLRHCIACTRTMPRAPLGRAAWNYPHPAAACRAKVGMPDERATSLATLYDHHHAMSVRGSSATIVREADKYSWECAAVSADGATGVGTWSCPGFYGGSVNISSDLSGTFLPDAQTDSPSFHVVDCPLRRYSVPHDYRPVVHEAVRFFVYPTLDYRVRPDVQDESDTLIKTERVPCTNSLNEHRMTELNLEHQRAYAISIQGIDYAGTRPRRFLDTPTAP